MSVPKCGWCANTATHLMTSKLLRGGAKTQPVCLNHKQTFDEPDNFDQRPVFTLILTCTCGKRRRTSDESPNSHGPECCTCPLGTVTHLWGCLASYLDENGKVRQH